MNILHINTNYVNNALHQNMIECLNRHGVCSKVLVPTCDAKNSVIIPNEYVTLCECFSKLDRVNYYRKQKKIYSHIKTVCDINSFDCIHAYTVFTDGNVAYNLKKEFGIPYVVAVRNTDINTFFKYMFHLRKRGVEILKNASTIIFMSAAYKNILLSKYIKSCDVQEIDAKSYIIPNGIDDFWLSNIPDSGKTVSKAQLKLCYAGKIDKNKNCALTVKACDELISQGYDITYTIVGNLIDRSFGKLMSERKYIQHIPFLKKDDLIQVYRENDIFVMPSFTESFGMVYLEAMSQGLPVIYTKGEGFDRQFDEGYVGYHVSSSDKNDIVESVKKIAADYDNKSNHCKVAVSNFSWDKICKKYVDIYNKILMG